MHFDLAEVWESFGNFMPQESTDNLRKGVSRHVYANRTRTEVRHSCLKRHKMRHACKTRLETTSVARYHFPQKYTDHLKGFGSLISAKLTDRIPEKLVRAIISGIAAEIVPKVRGPNNNSRACFVLSPSLLHARSTFL